MAPAPLLLSHPSSLEHDTGAHPERAERILAIEHGLTVAEPLALERITSPAATEEQITRVHPLEHVQRLEAFCAAGGGALDADTIVGAGSFSAALHAAGGAAALARTLLERGPASSGLAVHRPPGHHAEPARAMGFCLLGNIAIAAREALAAGARRVLIVDFDVHHGNGTEAIFRADRQVLFCSIHQSPLYPGTGAASSVGEGPGHGFTANLPVPPGSGDETFVSLVEHVALPLGRTYEPDLVLVSAGFDAHEDDPLAGCRVSDAGYVAMTAALRRLALELEVPLGLVLEGGYDLGVLARCVPAVLRTLGQEPAPAGAGTPEHPLALRARERLREFWPLMGSPGY
ncbi:MAG TPA: histone deacetylase [Solirubrobacteraceae bacterium]|jgi:acetoin utilization deacetylase AcuC-like enzyme|nr:histone deacetylase [Solirubrobacteraceae bacterium]